MVAFKIHVFDTSLFEETTIEAILRFGNHFYHECIAIFIDSSIPPSVNPDNDETLTTINFDEQLIKAHGQDGIIVYLLQMISDSLKSSQ